MILPEAIDNAEARMIGARVALNGGVLPYPPLATHSALFLGSSPLSSMGDHTWKVLARDDPGSSNSRGTPTCSFPVRKDQVPEDCLIEMEESPCAASASEQYKSVVHGNLHHVDRNFFVPCPGFAHGIIWCEDLIR